MSLLMDALKKAEAEKRAAAGDGGERAATPPAADAPRGDALELEPMPGDTSADAPTLSLEPEPPAAQPEEPPPSDESVRRAVADYLDGSRSTSVAQATAPAGELTGEVVGTPVSAQTVFAAARRRRAHGRWLAVAAVLLAATLLAAGAALYVAGIPEPRPLPSLAAARLGGQVPRPPLPAPAVPPTVAAEAGTPPVQTAASGHTGGADAGGAANTGEAVVAEVAPEASMAAAAASSPRPDPIPAAAAPRSQAAASGEPAPSSLAAAVPSPPPPARSAPAADLPPLSISRGRGVRDATAEALAAAHAAFRSGDLTTAAQRYRAVLAEDADNRAALLGVAAVALARGDVAQARARYREVLRRYPDDVAARAALFALDGYREDPGLLAALQVAAARSPAADLVYFTVGNHHARAGRWPEAERAYFEALRLAPDNPDYAFNLAVSLDHLGQRRAAARYYRRALDGIGRRPAVFPAARARERLAALTASASDPGRSP